MSSDFIVGAPTHSSTPKLEDSKKTADKLQSRKMASQMEVKQLNVSGGGKTVQRTVVEKSYSAGSGGYSGGSGAYGRSYVNETKIYPSSYQLRFGARARSAGYGRAGGYGGASGYGGSVGGVEASYTRVTVADGLELTPNLITTRAEEKAALGGLNDRFVTYIEKVRHLVNRNQILEAKVKQLEACQVVPSRAGDLYDSHIHQLQKDLEKAISEKTQVELELEKCFRELKDLQKKLEREIEDRKDAESETKSLCKDVDQATLARVELEGKVESLREELDVVRRAKDEDIRELTERLLALRAGDVVLDGPQQTDLSEALRDIRAAYEQLTQNNKIEVEGYYKSKIADLTDQLRDENAAGKNSKAELLDTRRQLQSVTVELEGLRTSSAALENQLEEVEGRYQGEIANYQSIIANLEGELNASRDKVQRQLVDYNELLNLKLSLDLEIQTYRKLLEGEEIRINESGYTNVSGGYGSNSSDKILVNVVEKVVTDESSSSSDNDGGLDREAIDMLQSVVEEKSGGNVEIRSAEQRHKPLVEEKDGGRSRRRGSSSSSSSSSSSDSESEI